MTTNERKNEIKAAIKNLMTVASFVNDNNKNTSNDCVEMINMLNRFLKSKLSYQAAVIGEESDELIHLHQNCEMWEMKHLVNALTK